MNPQAVPAALCAALAVGLLVYTVSRPWRRLGPRVDAYTVAVRSRMDGPRAQLLALAPPPSTAAGVLGGVFGPIVATLARRMSALLGHRDEAAVALALDRAGVRGVSPRTYAYQQLMYAAIGLAAGVAIGFVRGPRIGVVTAVGGCAVGAMRKRSELDRLTRHRQERMRSELVAVCHLLAIRARATPNIQQVVSVVCERGHGEVVSELRRVLASVESGVSPEAALDAMADVTAEPAAAGLYRALSLAVRSGGDLADTLRAQAGDLRDRTRDERKLRAAKRTQLITASNASLMVMPLLVLIGAGIPYMVLGSL